MAKLYLKFDQAVLKEVPLSQGAVTIGRLPDNLLQVDNLAVSGHHAKIYWDQDHYVLEDNNSLNGTYLNNQRVSRAILKDGDSILVGKHTVVFKDSWHEDNPVEKTQGMSNMPPLPKMESTMVMDTKKAKEMIAQAGAIAFAAAAGGTAAAIPTAPPKERTGILTVMEGKTDQRSYTLTSKMTVIGKSDMASIKLKGFFAPNMAALINRRDGRYFIAASEQKIKVKINQEEVHGQHELFEGDIVEVASVKMTFTFQE